MEWTTWDTGLCGLQSQHVAAILLRPSKAKFTTLMIYIGKHQPFSMDVCIFKSEGRASQLRQMSQ